MSGDNTSFHPQPVSLPELRHKRVYADYSDKFCLLRTYNDLSIPIRNMKSHFHCFRSRVQCKDDYASVSHYPSLPRPRYSNNARQRGTCHRQTSYPARQEYRICHTFHKTHPSHKYLRPKYATYSYSHQLPTL